MTGPGDDRDLRGLSLSRSVRRGALANILDDVNVAGVAYGRRTAGGMRTDEPAVVVYVHRKVSERFLPPSFLLPRRVYVGRDPIEVDVVETGPFYALGPTPRPPRRRDLSPAVTATGLCPTSGNAYFRNAATVDTNRSASSSQGKCPARA
ncbi:hypothetical protein [Streptosporangium sp. KLBMP 9127]|nr:hypothetical protein [Streptosporangium sp. KLBMP 9127]